MKPVENRRDDISKLLSRVAAFDFNELNTGSVLLKIRGHPVGINC
jgi:hypothetical protein